jgi:hypothetical protein
VVDDMGSTEETPEATAEQAMEIGPTTIRDDLAWTGGGAGGGQAPRLIQDGPQRSKDAALSASRSLSLITVAPELAGRGAVSPQVASRSNSRKKS